MRMIEVISLLERVYDRVVGKPGAGARVLADGKMAKFESLVVGLAKHVGIDGTPPLDKRVAASPIPPSGPNQPAEAVPAFARPAGLAATAAVPAAPMMTAIQTTVSAQPSLATLRALAAVLWPTENVQDFEGIQRRIWFDHLSVPGFDRAALEAKYGHSRHRRIPTAIAQAKVDEFFKAQVPLAPGSEPAPASSIPDLAQLRAVAAEVLPGRDYWAMNEEEIHTVLWQAHLVVPGMNEKALTAKHWRPTASTITIGKVVRSERQSRIDTLLQERRAFK